MAGLPASIITGQYPQTNGVLDLDGRVPPGRQLLPITMKRAGYVEASVRVRFFGVLMPAF